MARTRTQPCAHLLVKENAPKVSSNVAIVNVLKVTGDVIMVIISQFKKIRFLNKKIENKIENKISTLDNDCGDNSDEINCGTFECAANQWKCSSGHCIDARQRCNGIRNCLDFSDETLNCPPRYPNGRYCLSDQFTCNNTFCVPNTYQCDGDNDCGDGR